MKKILFKIVLLGLGLILGSLAVEGTLTVYRYFKHHTLTRAELISIRENMLQKELGPAMSPDPNRGENSLIIQKMVEIIQTMYQQSICVDYY